ncbi:hypothetical protein ARALYDRAFT_907364 [Arabidopsis lyrata subsp. lyrata]|uniref:Uncharacterized protein n=1 Tax=Arabidopsis lyrata subsp. lyrata TaxID=81972 RepID=D7LW78_ARALL|nr:hypothetical protein ARALYDRAFT_907364 [Arabidopsis lyrata subsp. lyrata]
MSTSDVELLKRVWREGGEETIEDYVENGIDPLMVSLYQMDLDRAQFLLRSYLRVRLLKVMLSAVRVVYEGAGDKGVFWSEGEAVD